MLGSSNTDLVTRVSRLPQLGECLTGRRFQVNHGGKGANQAVLAARLGADVSVVTRLGSDIFGENYLRHYRDEGIETSHVVVDDTLPSGATLVMVDEDTGLNTMVYAPGSNGALSVEDVRAAREAIVTADVLLCQLEVPVVATLEAFRHALDVGDDGPLRILNAAPIPPGSLPDELLELADVLVVNEEEAAYFSSAPVDTVDDAMVVTQRLAERWRCTTILTLGERGAVASVAGADPWRQEVGKVQAVDTTGAGDAFVGALAFLLSSDTALPAAVRRACEIAAMTVLRDGAQPSYPTREYVRGALGW